MLPNFRRFGLIKKAWRQFGQKAKRRRKRRRNGAKTVYFSSPHRGQFVWKPVTANIKIKSF